MNYRYTVHFVRLDAMSERPVYSNTHVARTLERMLYALHRWNQDPRYKYWISGFGEPTWDAECIGVFKANEGRS